MTRPVTRHKPVYDLDSDRTFYKLFQPCSVQKDETWLFVWLQIAKNASKPRKISVEKPEKDGFSIFSERFTEKLFKNVEIWRQAVRIRIIKSTTGRSTYPSMHREPWAGETWRCDDSERVREWCCDRRLEPYPRPSVMGKRLVQKAQGRQVVPRQTSSFQLLKGRFFLEGEIFMPDDRRRQFPDLQAAG